jgi:hypothetical protein
MCRPVDFTFGFPVGTVESEYDKFHKCFEG